jgi:hypothetical protein
MRTYKSKTFIESLSKELKKLQKKHKSPISAIKTSWEHLRPTWAANTHPKMIKDNIIFMESYSNPLIIQYKEQEILTIVRLITDERIDKVKILYVN